MTNKQNVELSHKQEVSFSSIRIAKVEIYLQVVTYSAQDKRLPFEELFLVPARR